MSVSIPIIYEDADMIAINKPAGIAVHPDGRSEETTISDWVSETRPEIFGVGEPIRIVSGEDIPKHGIVHRLDRDTSGVLVIAKTQPAFEFLKKQFQERHTEKTYCAIVYGNMRERDGVIAAPIGKSRSDFRRWSAERGARGKLRDAFTAYAVENTTPAYSSVTLFPKTGRTHQLRVHLKSIGHPVLCDKLYAPKRVCAGGMKRHALHAASITLSAPSGVLLTLQSPLPPDFERALAELGLS